MDDQNILRYLFHAMKVQMKYSNDMIFFKDLELRYVVGSKGFLDLVRFSSDDVTGLTDYDFFPPELAAKYIEDDRALLSSGKALIDVIEFIPNEEGGVNYASTSKYPVCDETGKVIGLYGFSRDVTAEIQLEEEKARSQLSNMLFDDVLEADITQNRMVGVRGKVWSSALGQGNQESYTEAVRKTVEQIVHPDHRTAFAEAFSIERLLSLYESGVRGFDHVTYLTRDGEQYEWVSYLSQMHKSKHTGSVMLISFLRNQNDEVLRQEQLKRKAATDYLTGLYNRRSLFDHIQEHLDENFALLFIDLDNFKHINDTYGHLTGDRVLKETGTKLLELCCENDLAGRIGGDEFMLILSVSGEQAVRDRIADIMEQLRAFWNGDEIVRQVTYSIGISFSGPGKGLEQLYAEADKAMYRAKRAGRDRVAYFE